MHIEIGDLVAHSQTPGGQRDIFRGERRLTKVMPDYKVAELVKKPENWRHGIFLRVGSADQIPNDYAVLGRRASGQAPELGAHQDT